MVWRIHALITGYLESGLSTSLLAGGGNHPLPKEEFAPYGYRYDLQRRDGTIVEGVMAPIISWLLESGDQAILVDTGVGSLDEIKKFQQAYAVDFVADIPSDAMRNALAEAGFKPEDISLVVNTHLHFDHYSNNELFTKARFIVQKEEISWALAPRPHGSLAYYDLFTTHLLNVMDQVKAIEGNMKIADGVEVVKVGGHTPGSMLLFVQTSIGEVAIAGDQVYCYKNLELDWPIGFYWRLDQVLASIELMRQRAVLILPNHDSELWERHPDGIIG